MTQEYGVFPVPLKIRYKGLFDWGELYRFVCEWFKKRQFRFHEQRYKDKIDTPLGNELEVNVWGEKEVTEYYKYRVDVYYHLWEVKEIPVMIDGKQVKRTRGRIHIELKAIVKTDWQERYKSDENIIHKLMEKFLNDVVLKYEREVKHIDVLDKDLHRLEADIKKFLKMETHPSSVG
ncbi:hypothetical protein AYK26_07400 [Euryarchaeota archaeon SM23-78]|nr:MAG: hypothetical protein AYK26_07400 [Euryarchaeota archaeon SM23-78]MBW3001285.1 hypothetical protein [Candidatus Woesearchaeota archaeon]